ncbi:uncharacterized protein LOC129612157 [Condylostylus longicornis]|uniref:uncharacterized protein LOC129612157 n=1 Tax=Condylostylus longicornis TaxID=2530218 RepID=UPI00244E1FBB|nr:uncharacterized protein LOC129612157 [Condylostylus longicornis]
MELVLDTNDDEIRSPQDFSSSLETGCSQKEAPICFDCQPLNGNIVFKDVWFAYPSRPQQDVLRGFSLVVPENSVVAVLGESGSGKSTLASLLLRFYDPAKGTIEVGNVDIYKHPPAWIRSLVGVVNQEPTLFAMTIEDNILYSKLTHQALHLPTSRDPKNEMSKLLEASNCVEFLKAFPDGLSTYVGERGVSLSGIRISAYFVILASLACRVQSLFSGGQKQRICLARALARHPRFLILDEATSALDTRSETIVHQQLHQATKNTTTIIITHRLSTLKYADYIAVLANGQLSQFGARSEVLRSPGEALHRILSSQSAT